MTYRWRVHTVLPERFGQLCQVIVCGRRRAVLVEFLSDRRRYLTRGEHLRKVAA